VDAAIRQAPVRDLVVDDPPLDAVIQKLYADAEARSVTS
jgi:hypothetical protein